MTLRASLTPLERADAPPGPVVGSEPVLERQLSAAFKIVSTRFALSGSGVVLGMCAMHHARVPGPHIVGH